MSRKPFNPTLSGAGVLRLAVASALLLQAAAPVGATELIAVQGPGGQALVFQQNGTTVADIVAPDRRGVSHNLFDQFDVSAQGLVLNNALEAGRSVLALELEGNAQFSDHAAQIIISEVVSNRASQLNGPMEIFGQSADFVALNPNGISVNGTNFINTPRADLIVGSSDRVDGALQYTTEFASGGLSIGEKGLRNPEGHIGLLAPAIDANGAIYAHESAGLDVVLGQNRFDTSRKLVSTRQASEPRRIDASRLGAMRAGRINIISTAKGVGVHLGTGPVLGRDGVTVRSAGGLHVSGRLVDQGVEFARIASDKGDVHLESDDDLDLRAVHIAGGQVRVKAGKSLRVAALEGVQDSGWQVTDDDKSFWKAERYYNKRKTSDTQIQGSAIEARGDAYLTAGDDLVIDASSVAAGGVASLEAARDVLLDDKEAFTERRDQGRHTKFLWKSEWDNSQRESTSKVSSVRGGQGLVVTAQRDITLRGAQVHSGAGGLIKAGGTLDVGTAVRTEGQAGKDYTGDNLGGLITGNKSAAGESRKVHRGSSVTTEGELLVSAADVTITGSKVIGNGGARVVSKTGGMTVDASRGESTRHKTDSGSHALGLFSNNQSQDERKDELTVSELQSDTNLQLVSAAELDMAGARINAAGEVELRAQGDVTLRQAEQASEVNTMEKSLGLNARAGEREGRAGQWEAGYAYGLEERTVHTDQKNGVASHVTGGGVKIVTPQDVNVIGSHVESTADGVDINAKKLNLLAGHDSVETIVEERERGLGYTYSGGLDSIGGDYGYQDKARITTRKDDQANVSTLTGQGGLRESLTGKHTSEGAQVKMARGVGIEAAEVENRAAQNTHSVQTESRNWKATIGGTLEYTDLTRPIEKVVNDARQRKFYDASLVAALDTPNLGVQAGYAAKSSSEESSSQKAIVSQIEGATVNVEVAGKLLDEGTRYRATEGKASVDAQRHDFTAATGTESSGSTLLTVDIGARTYTKTGKDVNLRLRGVGGQVTTSSRDTTAVAGSISGAQGVDVRVKDDVNYRGVQADGGTGDIDVNAGGDILFGQADSSQTKTGTRLQGQGSATFDKTAKGGKGSGVSLIGQLDHADSQRVETQAVVSTLDAQGKVRLNSGGKVTLEGTRVGSVERPVAGVELNAKGPIQVLASRDTHTASGGEWGGGLDIGGGKVEGGNAPKRSGNLGGRFALGSIDEDAQWLKGAELNSRGLVTLKSDAIGDAAVHLQGTQVSAPTVALNTPYGGILLESATSIEHRDNWSVNLGLGGSGGKVRSTATENPGRKNADVVARVAVDVDNLKKVVQQNTLIKATDVALGSAGNTQLEGVTIDAQTVHGQIGGDLSVQSRLDSERGVKVEMDLRLRGEKNARGYFSKLGDLAGPWAGQLDTLATKGYEKTSGKGEKGVVGTYVERQLLGDKSGKNRITPTVFADVSYVSADRVPVASAIAGAQGVALDVQGVTHLAGAMLKSENGKVELGQGTVETSDLHTKVFRREGGVNLSKDPLELVEGIRKGLDQVAWAETGSEINFGIARAATESKSATLKGGIRQAVD